MSRFFIAFPITPNLSIQLCIRETLPQVVLIFPALTAENVLIPFHFPNACLFLFHRIMLKPKENPVKKTIKILFILLFLPASTLNADTLDNALSLFDFAETTYPELLSPAQPEVQEIQGFYVRYYADTEIYLGVRGDDIYAIGGSIGSDLMYVGKIDSLIELESTDISDAIFSNQRVACSYYADNAFSSVLDIKRNILFTGDFDISVEGDQCVISSNSIPNHDFNDNSAGFATNVSEVAAEFRIPIEPVFADSTTAISLQTDNAVLLNGVKVDLLAAGCFGVGDGKIGCNDMSQPWRYDPMSPLAQFGTDQHNAHTQPDGTYHYHGNPEALFDQNGNVESPVIGFAADGFPIFGSYINDNGQVREVRSSFMQKTGARPSGSDSPGGNYDGTYVDDYEYEQGNGDLDECNGMMRNGNYGYYVVNEYPWMISCFKGTPNSSFNKAGGQGPPQ
ncbi:MAG: YHYH protein [Gammaproteobacteria bacterium]|nr:YHYH protein [Gammaproteobacteria bacterium]MBT3860803.1 YHYH protein [Gammaproteobacteria bacterium]MBT3986942.1 YHYH protein [Gammaproteobacteria bacterium]MBT4582077.1 YHYH protein [Gammaproteobacteria bacterium]MBT4658728.1 YHYH protein [Gammaproteobacteria bacterium]